MKFDISIERFKKIRPFWVVASVVYVLYAAVVIADSKSNEFGVEYETLGYQYDFIDRLVLNNVPFYIDKEGIIKVSNKHAEITKKLMQELETRPTTKVADRRYASAIALLFNKNSINYTVREDCKTGEIHFMWSREDDEVARRITGKEFMQIIQESYTTGRLGDHMMDKQ